MVRYDEIVINRLLDAYESSLLSSGENERTIHIEIKFTKTFLPAYFDESSGIYETIHIQMYQLQEKGLVQIIWKDKKANHIIQKVRLNVENLNSAYTYAKRTPKSEQVRLNMEMLEKFKGQTESKVCRKFIEYLLDRFRENKSVKEFMQVDELTENRNLLYAVQAVELNERQLYVREFSILNFQDSKAFERLLGKVNRVFSRFDETYKSKDVTEWLAELNIYQTPNFVYLKGNIKIRIKDQEMNLSGLYHGLGISGEDINQIEILESAQIEKIITIENLTTYFRWQENGSLIIYLGGYHNAVRRRLLHKIYKIFPNAGYYHFGDIDAGGFEIYKDLCDKTGIPFRMYHMGLEVLKKYECYGKKLTENDRKRLENMQEKNELCDVIAYMLQQDVKLEQECVGLEMITL